MLAKVFSKNLPSTGKRDVLNQLAINSTISGFASLCCHILNLRFGATIEQIESGQIRLGETFNVQFPWDVHFQFGWYDDMTIVVGQVEIDGDPCQVDLVPMKDGLLQIEFSAGNGGDTHSKYRFVRDIHQIIITADQPKMTESQILTILYDLLIGFEEGEDS